MWVTTVRPILVSILLTLLTSAGFSGDKVVTPVTVTDRSGGAVSGLEASDFIVEGYAVYSVVSCFESGTEADTCSGTSVAGVRCPTGIAVLATARDGLKGGSDAVL